MNKGVIKMSLEATELKFRSNTQNFKGYSGPLEFRPIRMSDTAIMTPILKSSAKSIRGYLGQYQHADLWDIKDVKKFVSRCVNSEFPSMHYLFLINNKVVGMGSLHQYGDSKFDVQIVLSVFGKENQGRGLGTAIGLTLKRLAFDIFGFHSFWWLCDATNRPSIKAAQKVGLKVHHQWEDEVKHSAEESGLWWAFNEYRPEDLPPAILQGESVEYWGEARNESFLRAVVESQNKTEL
jgi:RimJ/RimL family protein N-acetyltransferase